MLLTDTVAAATGGTFDFRHVVAKAMDDAMDWTPTARPHFRMSSFGQCARAQIATRAGLPPTSRFDDRTVMKLWTGTVIGKNLQVILERAGILDPDWTEREVAYRSYVGHVDGLMRKHPQGVALVEFKTSDDDAVTRHDWPEHYLWQTAAYMVGAHIPRCVLFQIGKNQGLSRTRLFELDDDWKAKVDLHINFVERLWSEYQETKELPHHWHQFEWEDRRCAYREVT